MSDSAQITIVLDRSGSMAAVRDATIAGFNEFVEGQKSVPGDCNLTMVQFDTDNPYEMVFDDPVSKIPRLTTKTYVPRGGTPLHDAIGRTITGLGTKLEKMADVSRPNKVIIVIMTDGLENSSHEYTAAKIAEMIKHQREVYKWEFIFLGANQDAILTGERLNIPAATAVSYVATATGVANTMTATTSNVRSYRATGVAASLAYSKLQREDAMEDDEKQPKPKVTTP